MSASYARLRELAGDDGHWVTVEAGAKSKEDVHAEVLERLVNYMQEELDKNDLKKMESSLFVE